MPRRKIPQELPKIKDTELVEYAVYARKSTEDDEKQKASIPQQLEQCFHYAENNNLPLKPRPLDFPPEDDIIRQIEEAYASTPDKCNEIRTKSGLFHAK